MTDLEKPPKATKWDLVHKGGKVGAAAAGGIATAFTGIPGLSALASEAYSAILKPPLAKRTDTFMSSVYEKLIILEEKVEGFSIESLKDNDLFTSIFWQAIQKALGNHQQEKLEALQNAVLNCAKGIDIDENMQMVLLRYVDDLTPLHLRTLKLLESPRQYLHSIGRDYPPNMMGSGLDGLIEHGIPELHKQHENIRIIVQDLYNSGLINFKPDMLGVTMSVSDGGIFAQRTTDMARVLLRYITAPKELKTRNS